jgi:hypothetical protein
MTNLSVKFQSPRVVDAPFFDANMSDKLSEQGVRGRGARDHVRMLRTNPERTTPGT